MLVLDKNAVRTLNGTMIGWYDDDQWVPSQVLVGCRLNDEQLKRATGCPIIDQLVTRDSEGKIIDVQLTI